LNYTFLVLKINILNVNMEDEKKILKECQDFAKKNGFKLNPNEKLVDFLIKGLLTNEKKYGKRYCPCRVVLDNHQENNKIICPCAYMRDEIKNKGQCHCGLFIKNNSF